MLLSNEPAARRRMFQKEIAIKINIRAAKAEVN